MKHLARMSLNLLPRVLIRLRFIFFYIEIEDRFKIGFGISLVNLKQLTFSWTTALNDSAATFLLVITCQCIDALAILQHSSLQHPRPKTQKN